MKLSLNWIKDFIDIPAGPRSGTPDLEISKLVYDLTMSTVEVEEAHDLALDFEKMAVGVVREILPHPGADKLVVCKVSIGDYGSVGDIGDACGEQLREIVCGGINLRKNMKVAVALPGSKVRWHGEGELIELKKTKVRGVESYGMICSSSEIGLFDLFPYTEEATIIDLSGFDAPAGTPLAKALGLEDIILTIDNKSLTNRPDLWGHYGIARELSAIYDLPLRPIPPALLPAVSCPPYPVKIDDSHLCPRYIGIKMENVSLMPAPFEIQSRIWRVGMRPINAIVDITNYVMLETGNPTHAFDADNVQGGIIVRRAAPGEKLQLLSGKDLSLTADDLVIADETEAIALAGVMGGEKDSILPGTSNVILEIANFNALTVRRTAMRHDIRTEAATRYEKGVDPQRAELAMATSLRLFKDIFPGMTISGFCDNFPLREQWGKRSCVDVSLQWLSKRLGRKLSNDHIKGLLERLGFEVSFDNDAMRVLVPSWRGTGDISLPDDIMEEIARIYGFENFEPAPISAVIEHAVNQPDIDIDRKIREYLARSCGMNEIFTYPWVDEEIINATLGNTGGMLAMSAPPSPGERFLRRSLIPGLCKAVGDNLRYFSEFAVFESAQVFFDDDFTAPYDERELLPVQRRYIAGAFAAPREAYRDVYRLAKGALEAMPRAVHIEPLTLCRADEAAVTPHWADEVVWQAVFCNDRKIGDMGLLSQKAALACGIKNAAVMLFELDIDALTPLPSRENTYTHIPEYPMTKYDISLLFDKEAKWEDIRKTALGKASADSLLRDVTYIEEYTGSQIPGGKKSVTIRLDIGSSIKTLTSEEIESCAASVIKRLSKNLGAAQRIQ